jgi:hypothetical protein
MPQTGGTHGPLHDDALKKEVRAEVLANRATRVEEWLEPEPPGEDQPDATAVLAGRPAPERGPDPDAIEARSDLARFLDRNAFPGSRDDLLAVLARHNAPEALTSMVAGLPRGVTFSAFHDVVEALGLPVEHRGTGG